MLRSGRWRRATLRLIENRSGQSHFARWRKTIAEKQFAKMAAHGSRPFEARASIAWKVLRETSRGPPRSSRPASLALLAWLALLRLGLPRLALADAAPRAFAFRIRKAQAHL